MPRRLRIATGGLCFHVLNRAVARNTIFHNEKDYLAMLKVLQETHQRLPTVRLLSFCLMPNHWHLVLWPQKDNQLSEFLRLLTVTHTQRYHAFHQTAGTGPVYQGRFKSFPVQEDHHLLSLCRYVERNALNAHLVQRAQDWPWSSFHARSSSNASASIAPCLLPLADWPVNPPRSWTRFVNRPQTQKELLALQLSIQRGRPYGDDAWQQRTAKQLHLQSSLRPRGRPHARPIQNKDSRPL